MLDGSFLLRWLTGLVVATSSPACAQDHPLFGEEPGYEEGSELSRSQVNDFLARPGITVFSEGQEGDGHRFLLIHGEHLSEGGCRFRIKTVPPDDRSLKEQHFRTADVAVDHVACEKVVEQGYTASRYSIDVDHTKKL